MQGLKVGAKIINTRTGVMYEVVNPNRFGNVVVQGKNGARTTFERKFAVAVDETQTVKPLTKAASA